MTPKADLMEKIPFRAKVWLYPGPGGWHFVSLPQRISKRIKKTFGGMKRGWGSLPIIATIKKTNWKTSLFPDRKSETYLLALKADVRKKEKINVGDTIKMQIEILIK